MSEQLLFRQESLHFLYAARLGRPSIRLGLPITVSALVSLVLAVGLTALVVSGNYTRRVDLHGVVLPTTGLFSIATPSGGWVRELAVHEGEAVKPGALLYTVDVDTSIQNGTVEQTIMSALMNRRQILENEVNYREDLAKQTQDQLTRKIANLQAQQQQLAQQEAMQESFEGRLRDEYTQFLRSFVNHSVTANDLDARQQAWMGAEVSTQQLKSQQLVLAASLEDAKFQQATDPISSRNDIAALKGKISEIDQDLANSEAHHSIVIRAPGAGVVTAIAAHPGQVVSAGTRVLTIVPTTVGMQADLLAPSAAVGFIHAGERVLLRYSAFPYQKFGQYWGTVASVSRAALRTNDEPELQGSSQSQPNQDLFYRVTVRPDRQSVDVMGEQRRLPANMQVNAYVLLDRRPLYQWILEPLYSVTHKLRAQ